MSDGPVGKRVCVEQARLRNGGLRSRFSRTVRRSDGRTVRAEEPPYRWDSETVRRSDGAGGRGNTVGLSDCSTVGR